MGRVVIWKTTTDWQDKLNRAGATAMNIACRLPVFLLKPHIWEEGVNEGNIQRAFQPWARRMAQAALERGSIGPRELDTYRDELDTFDDETLRLFSRLVMIQGEKSARNLTRAMVRLELGNLGALIKEKP